MPRDADQHSEERRAVQIAADQRRGRGAISNESSRFEAERREAFDDGWDSDDDDLPPPLRTEISIDASRSVIARNSSPDVPFDRSINPYRGCEHGCIYCFARPTHAFLGLSPGLDFETRILVKPNAAEILRQELARPRYRPAPIAIGTNTDPYQPIEHEHRIMRAVLETLRDHRHPVTIVTKGAMIMRDIDILEEMAGQGLARAALSVTTLDHRLARSMEPRASTPKKRLEAISALARAGVPVGVMTAPLIPAINDHEIEALLAAGKEAGAQWAEYVAIRMPLEIKDLFREWLAERFPDRADRVVRLIREMHGGRDYDPNWGQRMKGGGVYAGLIARRFDAARRRLGLDKKLPSLRTDLFRRTTEKSGGEQLSLL